ncbi:hypothetical protein L207DRAFT_527252 [Hyaloscypha variabilis F]|uniref:RING-type domain-containing protein n=1 Tax=Hyaloscypha variabilis (strain UAMH 11265 / GT02V1 / F) TaxID=1149755 RepID=A0A2J6RV50_HYAVF|nr:hypothetical protein L207DRAFT_527252 [Hyaloscypha variabilis F]
MSRPIGRRELNNLDLPAGISDGPRVLRTSQTPARTPRTPAARAPAARAPAARTPVARTPRTPAARTPAARTPNSRTPAARTPAARTPAARTPNSRTPAARAPAARTPAARTPAARTGAAPRTPAPARTAAARQNRPAEREGADAGGEEGEDAGGEEGGNAGGEEGEDGEGEEGGNAGGEEGEDGEGEEGEYAGGEEGEDGEGEEGEEEYAEEEYAEEVGGEPFEEGERERYRESPRPRMEYVRPFSEDEQISLNREFTSQASRHPQHQPRVYGRLPRENPPRDRTASPSNSYQRPARPANVINLRERRLNRLQARREEDRHTSQNHRDRSPSLSSGSADILIGFEDNEFESFLRRNEIVLRRGMVFVSRATVQESGTLECIICTQQFGEGYTDERGIVIPPEDPVLLECGHIYGRSCIEHWLDESGGDCPMRCQESRRSRERRNRAEQRRRELERQEAADRRAELRDQVTQRILENEPLVTSPIEDILMPDVRASSISIPSPTQWRSSSRRSHTPAPSSRRARDNESWYTDYLNCRPVHPRTIAPRGYVVSEDRSRPGNYIYKRVMKCFPYMRGHQLLLSYPNRIRSYEDLWVYDLEAQSLHPGKMAELGHVTEPGDEYQLRRFRLDQWTWEGIASVKQSRSVFDWNSNRLRRPQQSRPFARAGLINPNGEEFWFDEKLLHRVFGPSAVDSIAELERRNRGQSVFQPIPRRPVRLEVISEQSEIEASTSEAHRGGRAYNRREYGGGRALRREADRNRTATERGDSRREITAPGRPWQGMNPSDLQAYANEFRRVANEMETRIGQDQRRQRRRARGVNSQESTL